MKQKLLLLVLLATSLTSYAQEVDTSEEKENRVGVIAGATFSKFNTENWKNGTNFMIGVTAERNVSDKFTALINLNYERHTTTANIPFSVYDGTTGINTEYPNNKNTATLSYLSIPLAFRYYTDDNQSGLCFHIGACTDILISDKLKADHYAADGNYGVRPLREFNSITLGLNLGAGYAIPVKNGEDIVIDLRYNTGLTAVNKGGVTNLNTIMFGANYRFSL